MTAMEKKRNFNNGLKDYYIKPYKKKFSHNSYSKKKF